MKNLSTLLLFLFFCLYGESQTLFTYGKHAVSKDEFITAFNKNNNGEKPTEKALRDYLTLYTKYKLKVRAAYDLGIDTGVAQLAELTDFRNQIADTYLNDQSTIDRLVKEAYERSKKDIRVGHIYIPVNQEHPRDTAKAFKLANDAYNELKRGTDFGNVAALYSADTLVRTNKGDIGFITAFTLPYEIENVIYTLPKGGFSKPYHSRSGYHVFKNLDERPAAGKVKAAQILLLYPPDAAEPIRKEFRQRADSIYNALSKGASFNALAIKYNNDRVTYGTNGEMEEFGVGRYDAKFEQEVFALSTANQLAKPIETAYGLHIVKLIDKKAAPADTTEAMQVIRDKVNNDSRVDLAKQEATRKIILATGIKKAAFNEKNLMIYADSAYYLKKLPTLPGINSQTTIFILPKQKVTVADWTRYLGEIRDISMIAKGKNLPQLLQQYKEVVAVDYYQRHLEDFNKEFAKQLQDFKEGNMLFEVMQKNVWDKASADSLGLQRFYSANAAKYFWEPSADVILFSSMDSTAISDIREKLSKNKTDWRKFVDLSEGKIQADSGRYELAQLPSENKNNYKAGMLTVPVRNTTDGITSFFYIQKIYTERSPRTFEEAKGFVLNDYQLQLEEQWINDLKKKYPVRVNENVLKSILSN